MVRTHVYRDYQKQDGPYKPLLFIHNDAWIISFFLEKKSCTKILLLIMNDTMISFLREKEMQFPFKINDHSIYA
jgi:hypothetical protein